jgi:arylformamidase
MSWRTLSPAERERAYSPSSCIGGNYQPFMQAYAQRSQQARAQLAGRLNLHYGAAPAQRLDLFVPPSEQPPPLLLFIHGGYWQELSKEESAFSAADCVQAGIAFAALDYTLAPQAPVAQMVDECQQALAWLHKQAAQLGFDARRIVAAGSSAGAHLASMLALRAPGQLAAAVLVSGIYELEPLIGTSINTALGLDTAAAQALSPVLMAADGFPRSIVAWGEIETAEFKRQSLAFAAQLRQAGTPCQEIEVPARNHFDVILDLAKPGTNLGDAVHALLRSL